jgi:hypothetical protein
MHRLKEKSTNCEENAQIVFLLRIETTDCEENTYTVILPQIETTNYKKAQIVQFYLN